MPIYQLNNELLFPPVHLADKDGLLAAGGDLSAERLLLAYRSGIFPWYDAPPILWWSPDPRFVLFPHELRISKSMQALLKKGAFRFSVDEAFETVITQCQSIARPGQWGTWITDEMHRAYCTLHRQGYAHSAEAWVDNELVGGLYGVQIGKVFFGESMFSTKSNASKYAFILYVRHLINEGVQMIDCQVYTDHLESLGARMIPRKDFIQMILQWTKE